MCSRTQIGRVAQPPERARLEGQYSYGLTVSERGRKIQNTIAQSSAEFELLAIVFAATEALGCMFLATDLALVFDTRLHVDAAAALGILERRGVGRIRHLDVGALWLQDVQLRQMVGFVKVKGMSSPGRPHD